MALPIALQVYTVRDYAEQDFRGTMEQIKKMGYDGVELAGLYGSTAVEAKKILDEVGLTLVSAHVPMADLMKDEVLADYAAAGTPFAVIPWLKTEATEEFVSGAIAQITEIAEKCKANGMTLLYHNHDFEFEKLNDKYVLEHFYDTIPADLLQTELDTCWVNVGGEEPAAYVKKYTGRAPIVHLKDFNGSKSENMYELIGDDETKEAAPSTFEFRPVGYGLQNIPAIIKASEEAGAKWLVVEQDQPSMDKTPMECAEMSINYLKKVL